MTSLARPDDASARVRNRRVTVRYRCAPATAGRVSVGADQEFQRAWIDNVSRGGMGMYVSKPVAVGADLVVQLKGTLPGVVYEAAGHVIHSTLKEPFGWFVGVEFLEPLADAQLDALC